MLKFASDEKEMFARACQVIPDGVQTMSKQPCRYVDGVYPKFITSGKGPYVYDRGHNEYVDFTCGLGTNLLGHADEEVNKSVMRQLRNGLLFGQPNPLEMQVAEQIIDLLPSAGKVRFVKTGSEAASAAVRIARAYTGKDRIVTCGYHGWHDWYAVSTDRNAGVPSVLKKLRSVIPYNDDKAIYKIREDTAAVILEPYIFEAPKNQFLEQLISYCRSKKILVIFDEVITFLRTMNSSAQLYFSVKPDLTIFGKALGNGMPIAGVCGRSDVMSVLEGKCFVSSTFGGELAGLAAAQTVLDICKTENVDSEIWSNGKILQRGYNQIAEELGLDTECVGYPCRTFFRFPSNEHRALFWQECLEQNVLFGQAQFVSFAHTSVIMQRVVDVCHHALEICKENWKDPQRRLRGSAPQMTVATQERLERPAPLEINIKKGAKYVYRESDNQPGTGNTGGPDRKSSVAEPGSGNAKNVQGTDAKGPGEVLAESTEPSSPILVGDSTAGEASGGNSGPDEHSDGERDRRDQSDRSAGRKKKRNRTPGS